MSANIEGMLRNYKRKKMTGLIQDDSGRNMSDTEARRFLAECQAKGWKLIPCGDCEGFDHFDKGCPGHPVAEDTIDLTSNCFVVALPEDYEPVAVGILKDTPCLICKCGDAEDSLFLPPGTWQFLFTTKDVTEEQAAMIVDRRMDLKDHPYKGYEPAKLTVCWNSVQSFESLLRSKNLDTKKNFAVLKRNEDEQ